MALPVGQGDAFLHERDGRRVLVDGGKAQLQAVHLLTQERVKHVDVVVCTHNDQDHAEGVAGLLETIAVRGRPVTGVGEVWLPGRWSERIVDLCEMTPGFLAELVEGVERSGAASLEAASSEPLGDGAQESRGRQDGSVDATEERILGAIDGVDQPAVLPWHPWEWPWFPGGISESNWKLWVDCLTAASRIRRIAKAARDAGARIRWFDYEEFERTNVPLGGVANFLVPVNAVEITQKLAKKRLSAFDYLRLSVANRESLVFHAPPTQQDGEILFCADSDLSFPVPPMANPLVTAPHHGSESNKGAYAVVRRQASGSVTWVRSDGRFRKRPGATFLSLKAWAYCTRCRQATGPGQAVRAAGVNGSAWQPSSGVQACHCL